MFSFWADLHSAYLYRAKFVTTASITPYPVLTEMQSQLIIQYINRFLIWQRKLRRGES
jgi:hypothetical protein